MELALDGSGTRDGRHRAAVLRPHAAAARHARRVGSGGRVQGRPRGRRAPHRRGRAASRWAQALARGARRQGRDPPLRVDHGAARRGRGRGRARPRRDGRSSSTRSRSRPRRSARSTPASSRTSSARSRQTRRAHAARPPAVGTLAAPRRRGRVQGAGEGARRRVQPDRPRRRCPRTKGRCGLMSARVAVLDYGMRQPPLRLASDRARSAATCASSTGTRRGRRRRRARDPRASAHSAQCIAGAARRGVSIEPIRDFDRDGHARCSACASGCRCCSRGATRTPSQGWRSLPGRSRRLPRT